jgi:hypothetical protein
MLTFLAAQAETPLKPTLGPINISAPAPIVRNDTGREQPIGLLRRALLKDAPSPMLIREPAARYK